MHMVKSMSNTPVRPPLSPADMPSTSSMSRRWRFFGAAVLPLSLVAPKYSVMDLLSSSCATTSLRLRKKRCRCERKWRSMYVGANQRRIKKESKKSEYSMMDLLSSSCATTSLRLRKKRCRCERKWRNMYVGANQRRIKKESKKSEYSMMDLSSSSCATTSLRLRTKKSSRAGVSVGMNTGLTKGERENSE